MSLKVKVLNPLATVPTIAHPSEDLGYDVYALRVQGQMVNEDGTPVNVVPARLGIPTIIDSQGRVVHPIRIEAGKPTLVDTGISVHFTKEEGKKYGLLIRDRSSIAKRGLFVTAGVIDAGYRGELKIMFNLVTGSFLDIWPGEKIAQLIPIEVLTDTVEKVDSLEESERKEAGFGSSGN